MGHDVLYCDFCSKPVMEGSNDWRCNCGGVCSAATGYTWQKGAKATLVHRPLGPDVHSLMSQRFRPDTPKQRKVGTRYKSQHYAGLTLEVYKDKAQFKLAENAAPLKSPGDLRRFIEAVSELAEKADSALTNIYYEELL